MSNMNKKNQKQDENVIHPIGEENAFYEKLLLLRSKDPKAFNVMSPATKLSLLQYEAGRREFIRLETLKTESK